MRLLRHYSEGGIDTDILMGNEDVENHYGKVYVKLNKGELNWLILGETIQIDSEGFIIVLSRL